MVYVIDDDGVLIDDIRVRELLLVPVTAMVSDLMNRRFVALRATDSERGAIEVFRREDRTALPVTDESGVLIGIVTVDDVLDAAQEIATRDLQRFGGSEALGEPYMAVPVARMIRKRAGWLVVLFLGELLTATAMGFFEDQIARAVVLALFVPLIISSGGNSGSQASTLVIRALALGELSLRDWWRVARREVVSGLALGVILGSIGFMRIAGWSLVHGHLRPALAAGRHHGGDVTGWRRAVGIAGRIDAAVRAPARGLRSGDVLRAICRNTGGRDRPCDLLLGRRGHPSRHPAVTLMSPSPDQPESGARSRAFLAAFLGWMLDGYDFTILTLVLIDIQRDFQIDNAALGALGTVTLLTRLVGGVIAGAAADRWGRKLPLMVSIVWFSLFAFASGLSTSYAMLFVFRALFGFGMGGEWAAGMPLVLEHWPEKRRGLVLGVLQGAFSWGFVLAAAMFQFGVPLMNELPAAPWRVLMWTGIVPALLGAVDQNRGERKPALAGRRRPPLRQRRCSLPVGAAHRRPRHDGRTVGAHVLVSIDVVLVRKSAPRQEPGPAAVPRGLEHRRHHRRRSVGPPCRHDTWSKTCHVARRVAVNRGDAVVPARRYHSHAHGGGARHRADWRRRHRRGARPGRPALRHHDARDGMGNRVSRRGSRWSSCTADARQSAGCRAGRCRRRWPPGSVSPVSSSS